MGKRSSFERVERDFYPTPFAAVVPLLPHLADCTRFIEPCAGDGALIDHLEHFGHKCVGAIDIEPGREGIERGNAISCEVGDFDRADCFITNPPWARYPLHPIIQELPRQLPTWLLFDADWPHTKQAIPFLPRLRKIVSVGRVKWIPDSKMTGKDNCCWYLFDRVDSAAPIFVGRQAL